MALVVSGDGRHAGRGAIAVGRTLSRPRLEALNYTLNDEEVYFPF